MYKIMLSCFVIVSCFLFFACGQDPETPLTHTDCDKYQNCTACLDNNLNCTFCVFPPGNATCTNATVCPDQGRPVQNKTQCSLSTTLTPETPSVTVTVPVTTSESPVTESSSSDASESTTIPSKPSPAPSGRHFDPPSFIGGTVLSLGLLAIIYVGFKFYKARTERNYHTL